MHDILALARTRLSEAQFREALPAVKRYLLKALADDPEAARMARAQFDRLVYTNEGIITATDEEISAALQLTRRQFTRINRRLNTRYRLLTAQFGGSTIAAAHRTERSFRYLFRRALQFTSRAFV